MRSALIYSCDECSNTTCVQSEMYFVLYLHLVNGLAPQFEGVMDLYVQRFLSVLPASQVGLSCFSLAWLWSTLC